ncbi:MAG: ABC transporter transmembrane domain-containing protein, partial [Gammaproteobacteria bacterium]|nr:ABC transporter transmembrane domain-containing protein [Gammaproteobacteria bacterium]
MTEPRTSDASPSPRAALGSLGTLRTFLPYLWPRGEWGLRTRVLLAIAALVAAKVAVVYVPIFYRDAVDALDIGNASAALTLPVGVILAYGGARVLSLAFGELRDALFAKVGQRAMRTVALQVFRHLHSLSLGFHLSRQTGGLSRSIERGTNAIETLLRFTLFSIAPTLLEVSLVFVILWRALDVWVALVTVSTVVVYIAYTMFVTEWRIKFRRAMNEEDSRANTRAIDSLLNYETVKYFGNEEHEARRFDV